MARLADTDVDLFTHESQEMIGIGIGKQNTVKNENASSGEIRFVHIVALTLRNTIFNEWKIPLFTNFLLKVEGHSS